MKKTILYLMMFCCIAFLAACSEDNSGDNGGTGTTAVSEQTVSGSITQNTTWTADKHWILDGIVKVKDGVTLTIESGTLVKGKYGTKATLVVLRGGQLKAEGTATSPIVFTSDQAPGRRQAGDWGGIILCGKAKCNAYDPANPDALKPEGGLIDAEICYGGTDDGDSSGALKYVRIEFAGYVFQEGNEINGFTLCAVGNGTKISHIQVSYANDDSYEWFGGTVNCDHLVSYGCLDDDFDTDNGFSGLVQYGLILRDPAAHDQSNSNGFESDNNAAGDATKLPMTSAVFSNISAFGPLKDLSDNVSNQFGFGVQIRRSSSISVFNSVFAGFAKGVILDTEKKVGGSTHENAIDGNLVINNVILAGCKETFGYEKASSANADTVFTRQYFTAKERNNKVYKENSSLLLNANNFTLKTPAFIPQSGSPLLNAANASFNHTKLANADKTATYVGAFKDVDWTADWCEWNPQNADYSLKKQ